MKLRDVKTWRPIEQFFFGLAAGLWLYVILGFITIIFHVLKGLS